jgi:hypothetical protein
MYRCELVVISSLWELDIQGEDEYQKAEETRRDYWRDFLMCETITGQHLAQLRVT